MLEAGKRQRVAGRWWVLAGALLAGGTASGRAEGDGGRLGEGNGCVGCHESAPGELSRAVVEWRKSVHAENDVSCDACHGGDPGVQGSPGDRDAIEAAHFAAGGFVRRPEPARKISYFCGRCHAAIKEKHLGSPHGKNVHPTCLYCHDHHDVRSPDTSIIAADRCTVCHDFRNAAQIREILEETEQTIATLDDRRHWLEENGYRSLALEEMHHHGRSTVTQLRVAFHSFHLGDVMNFASQVQAVLDRTERTVDLVKAKEEARKVQTWIGLGISVFLFSFAVLLMAYKRRYLDRDGEPGPVEHEESHVAAPDGVGSRVQTPLSPRGE